MELPHTLFLTSRDVAGLLTIDECMVAVEEAFRLYAEGKVQPPKVLATHTQNGGFHIKTGTMGSLQSYFVAKLNANFPANPALYNLPSIQGIVVVCDAINGRLLSVMDSIEITIIRTGAATAIAAKYLALPHSKIATICGCGNQGRISLQALMKVRKLEKVFVSDVDEVRAEKFALEFGKETLVTPISQKDLPMALKQSHICVTCTPSREPFIQSRDIMPGTFIAAVGADSEEKHELYPDLIASSKIVADVAEQSAAFGDLHHAINLGLITISGIHAELGSIIAGIKPGRESDNEIIVFDSTGTAIQDVAAAKFVYEKALAEGTGTRWKFYDK
ncbi:MAG TPA: ornithine cyclodeaminase family protein [Chitinophagaceae bacterium]